MIIMMVGILGIAIALIFRLSQPLGPLNSNLSEGRFIIPDGSSVMSVSRFGSSFYLLIEDKTTGMRYIEERSIDDHTILARFRLVPE